MDEMNWLVSLTEKNQLAVLIKTNEYTEQFGLSLSEKEAELLVQNRACSLREQQRIEFKGGILPKLIFAFCDSQYIYQDNYVDTISRLQEIFYMYKNESLDEMTDDELIEQMKDSFENECEGSLDYLEETSLDGFARNVREGDRSFLISKNASQYEPEE